MSARPNLLVKAREAFRLSNDLMMDLMTGMQAYRTFQLLFARTPALEPIPTQTNRLCLFHIIFSLAKWIEFYDRYLDVIPDDTRQQAKSLKKEIENRGIAEFRNKVVGHIWDTETKRALTNSEIGERLSQVIAPDVATFMAWVNDPNDDGQHPDEGRHPDTVASIIERVRDRIREVNGFTDEDLAK